MVAYRQRSTVLTKVNECVMITAGEDARQNSYINIGKHAYARPLGSEVHIMIVQRSSSPSESVNHLGKTSLIKWNADIPEDKDIRY